jgi:hypothetical protein
MTKWQILYYGVAFFLVLLFVGKQVFNFLLKGFAPFISSRPWVIEQLLQELDKMGFRGVFQAISIGSGRSGLIYALEKKFPKVECIGIDDGLWPTLVSRVQVFLHRSHIKVMRQDLRHIDVSQADLIYCKLDLPKLREFEKKFKFECKPGAVVLSNGFVVPNMPITRVIDLERRKGRFAFFSRDLKSKYKKNKEENKVFVYVI